MEKTHYVLQVQNAVLEKKKLKKKKLKLGIYCLQIEF